MAPVKVVVVGGGSWGTCFASLLRDRGHEVTLACRDPEQVRAMLKQAASTIPTAAVPSTNAKKTAGKAPSAWRSAGPRASDGSEMSQLLYWKR